MFIWINRANQLSSFVAAGLFLSACLPSGFDQIYDAQKPYVVLGGALRIAVPQGYCLDRNSLVTNGDTFVALAGRCVEGTVYPAAVISIAVGPQGTAVDVAENVDELISYFETQNGLAALSAAENTPSITLISAQVEKQALLLHLKKHSATKGGLQSDTWRAIVGLSGRLITISISGRDGDALTQAQGAALLKKVISAMAQSQTA